VKLTVFGASGPTGQQLVSQAVDRGHEVTAAVESTAPASRFRPAVETVEVDVYAGDNVERAVADASAVCAVFRHTKSTPDDYLAVSGQNVLDAMESVGLRRYLTVAPATVQRESEQCGLVESVACGLLELLRPTVTTDAADHVADVTSRDLDWTVVRVLRVGDGPTTRQYKTGDIKLGVSTVSYGDLSSFLLDCCERGIYPRMLPKIKA